MGDKHPDLFSPREAARYLHLDSLETLNSLRRKGWLRGYQAGQRYMYYRIDLDDCALRIVGIEPPARQERKSLKLAE